MKQQLPSCQKCRFYINDKIPFLATHGYCGLTRKTIDHVSSDVLFVSYKYNYAYLERKANGACKPEGLLYQYEPNVVKRWQNGTLHVAMLIITYIILVYLVCLILAEIVYFM